MRRRPVVSLLVGTAMLACGSPAAASTELGQTFVPTGGYIGPLAFQSTSGAGTPSYVVPSGGGVITSWSHIAMLSPPGMMKFVVIRAVGLDHQAVGVTDYKPLNGNFLNKFDTRISVQAGDMIGLRASTTGVENVRFTSGSTMSYSAADPQSQQFIADGMVMTQSSYQVDVSATLEPDADHDGFGDESQDQCPTDASTQGACPIPPDKKAPVASTSGSSTKQDVLKQGGVSVVVSSDEAGSASASGTLNTPGASKVFTLTSASATLQANVKTTLTLKLTKKIKKALKKSLGKRKKPKANVTIVIKDAAGNASTLKQSISVKGRKKKSKRRR